MRSRIAREGSLGLLLLVGLGVFGAGVAWLKGFNPANRSYTITVNFPTIDGVQNGSTVRYRGVTIGRITDVKPGSNGVAVKITIAPADLLIPANVQAAIDQSGLLGESIVNLTPKDQTPVANVAAKPLDRGCDQIVILCDGSTINGDIGVSTDALVKSSIRFADTYGKPEFYNSINALTTNSGKAAAEIALLAKEFGILTRSVKQEVPTLANTTVSIGNAADSASVLAGQAGVFTTQATSTASRAEETLVQINALLANNRGTLVSTLDNINVTSASLRRAVTQLSPTVDRVQNSRLLSDLETLSTNAAIASKNLRDASQNLNNPANLATLQQTLDAARATFQNTQKITADLDELTGDPAVRSQFKNVLKGFSGLLSSTQQLEQQAQYAQRLAPIAQQVAAQAAAQQQAMVDPPARSPSSIAPPIAAPSPTLGPLSSNAALPPINPRIYEVTPAATILPPTLSPNSR